MTHTVIGRWAAEENSHAFLEFHEDGSLNGSDGANALVTSWTDGEQGPMITPSFSTLRAAPGMVSWVTKARRVAAVGDRLEVFDASDNHLGALIRQAEGAAADQADRDR